MMTTTEQPTVREITTRLNDAASLASSLMNMIDDGDVSGQMQSWFAETMLKTREGMDKARQLDDALAAMYTTLTVQKARIDEALEIILNRQQALYSQVKRVISDNPDVPFRDLVGKKVYLKPSNPSLKFAFEVRKKTVNHIVPEGGIVPTEYTEIVTFRVVNTAAVRKALNAGTVLHFAWLEQSQALCGL